MCKGCIGPDFTTQVQSQVQAKLIQFNNTVEYYIVEMSKLKSPKTNSVNLSKNIVGI